MDKAKRSLVQPSVFRIMNWILITAIIILTGHLVATQLFSQPSDLSDTIDGTWTGIITDDYGSFIVYDFTIQFDLDEANKHISGTTYAQSLDEYRNLHAGTIIRGEMIDSDTLSYYDTSINGANGGWCKIRSTLELTNQNGVPVLSGKWYGFDYQGCTGTSGRIHLTKAN